MIVCLRCVVGFWELTRCEEMGAEETFLQAQLVVRVRSYQDACLTLRDCLTTMVRNQVS